MLLELSGGPEKGRLCFGYVGGWVLVMLGDAHGTIGSWNNTALAPTVL